MGVEPLVPPTVCSVELMTTGQPPRGVSREPQAQALDRLGDGDDLRVGGPEPACRLVQRAEVAVLR
jgi:hypothetical protein